MNRRYLDNLLNDQGMSMRSLAKLMNMKHSQLSLTFSGARRLQLDEAVKMSSIFGVPLQVIAANAGTTDRFEDGARISVTGAMRGTGIVEPLEVGGAARVSVPAGFVTKDAVAAQARTADTPLSWMDGVVWVCRPMHSVGEGIGRLCWLTLPDGREVIATPRRGYAENRFNLTGPFQAENTEVTSGLVVLLTLH